MVLESFNNLFQQQTNLGHKENVILLLILIYTKFVSCHNFPVDLDLNF